MVSSCGFFLYRTNYCIFITLILISGYPGTVLYARVLFFVDLDLDRI